MIDKITKFDGFRLRVGLLSGILLFILSLSALPRQAHAQDEWPPFNFRLSPLYQEGKITYNIRFSSQTEGSLTNVTIKIPLPEGTRFLESGAESSASVSFDGEEITFFAATVHRPIREAYFTVEVIDPTITVYTTHAWLSWEGDLPGTYLTEDDSFDITLQPLNWEAPRSPRLQLRANAVVSNTNIIYTIYPKHDSNRRIWDLKVTLPVPEGVQFLSAEAPPAFTTGFDGHEVSFSTIELEEEADVTLRVTASISDTTKPFFVTHAWATWKNAGRGVGVNIDVEDGTQTGDIVVQPYASQVVISDEAGDTPFGNYDLTSIALQDVLQDGAPAFKVTYYTAQPLLQTGEPLDFMFLIDSDCNAATGQSLHNIGADYRIRYSHDKDQSVLDAWTEQDKRSWLKIADLNSLAGAKMVATWVPYAFINDITNFCWIARSINKTKGFDPKPPDDWIPQEWRDLEPNRYEAMGTPTVNPLDIPPAFYGIETANENEGIRIKESDTLALSIAEGGITGKLAVPLDNGQGFYDIHVFSIPDGQEIISIPNARQPHFRVDGQRMLANGEGSENGDIFEYNFLDGTKTQASDALKDSHPFYNLDASRVVYDNPELFGANQRQPFIFLQCGLLPPHEETAPQCRDASFGILTDAGKIGQIRGSHPVWTADDMIAYTGCSGIEAGTRLCGIYTIPFSSTRGISDGYIPVQLTDNFGDIPSDTQNDLLTFTTQQDGDWEAYIMHLDGTRIRNLSNSPTSNDGLPTLSPDNEWVAFVSDREGQWAVWVADVKGDSAKKLFDLPTNAPWGSGDRDWINERISWGS